MVRCNAENNAKVWTATERWEGRWSGAICVRDGVRMQLKAAVGKK